MSSRGHRKRLMLLQTTTTQENAIILTEMALKSGLSPCIQQTNIASHYFWKNEMCYENEILLSFKVFKRDFKDLRQLILYHHTYDLPEIIGIKLYKISKKYKKWCEDSTIKRLIRKN